MDAVFVESDPRLSFPDTGSAREDLRLQISRVATLFTNRDSASRSSGYSRKASMIPRWPMHCNSG